MLTSIKHFRSCVILLLAFVGAMMVTGMSLYQVRLVETDKGRLIETSNINYALTSGELRSRNWSCVSVNGEDVLIFTQAGDKLVATKSSLAESDLQLIKRTRDSLANGYSGYTHIRYGPSNRASGESIMINSAYGDSRQQGGYSYSGSGAGTSTYQLNDLKINMRDDSNFSISKSDLPYGWSQVFINGDLVTHVYKDGRVVMQPINKLSPDELQATNKIKSDAIAFQKAQMRQFTDTMSASMDMVNGVFSNMMRNLPKPPSFDSSSMFGSDFPFGPNRNPFSPERGWPFGPDGMMGYDG